MPPTQPAPMPAPRPRFPHKREVIILIIVALATGIIGFWLGSMITNNANSANLTNATSSTSLGTITSSETTNITSTSSSSAATTTASSSTSVQSYHDQIISLVEAGSSSWTATNHKTTDLAGSITTPQCDDGTTFTKPDYVLMTYATPTPATDSGTYLTPIRNTIIAAGWVQCGSNSGAGTIFETYRKSGLLLSLTNYNGINVQFEY